MKAPHDAQLRLLDLQALDTRIAQVDHRAARLPERQAHDALVAQHAEADLVAMKAAADAQTAARELTRAETDVAQVRERSARTRARLDAGQGSAKELQAMQHEVESLTRRQATLEDEQLEAMERSEGLATDAEKAGRALEDLHDKLEGARADLDRATAAAAQERNALADERADLAARLPEDLVALYEKVRAHAAGAAAAALIGKRCGGCRIELGPIELQDVVDRPEDEVVRCPDCRCLIVRTGEADR